MKPVFFLVPFLILLLSSCAGISRSLSSSSGDEIPPLELTEAAYQNREELSDITVTFYKTVDQRNYECSNADKKIRLVPQFGTDKEKEAKLQTI